VTVPDTPKGDEIDAEMERWIAENQTASDVMSALIGVFTENAEKYHIPFPMVYVHLSVLAILIRSQMTVVANGDPVQLAQIQKLDQFIGRMSGNGKEYQTEVLRRIEEFETHAEPPHKPMDGCASATSGMYR
jgi:hypothetical protein